MKSYFFNHRKNSFFKCPKSKGFSLVEMIVYVAIFTILFSVILQLFWRVQLSGSRLQVANEIKENVSQVVQLIQSSVREGASIEESACVFEVHPGVLVIDNTQLLTFDTYSREVNIGGRLVDIRTLRMTQGLDPSLDLTSSHVNVNNFVVTNLSQPGHPGAVQLDLTISNVNPDNDPDFDSSLSVRTSITVRQES